MTPEQTTEEDAWNDGTTASLAALYVSCGNEDVP